MFKRGSSKHHMCPYCGGMHAPGQCPMFMIPAMPPMMPPMAPPMAPPMVSPIETDMMPKMHEMQQMMMHHTKMLEHISHRVDQIYDIVKSIQLGMAKG